MSHTYITSSQLARTPGVTKQATKAGPVFISERGQVEYVLLSLADYERLLGRPPSLAEALSMPGDYIEFEPVRLE